MSSKLRNVALLLPAFVLATGLASAQPGVKVSTVNSDGTVTSSTLNDSNGGPVAKAPFSTDGNAKYWDGLYIGGASTNYFTQVPYITQPPNPQIAVGPDDILTIVNRTISRYPNPNSAGQVNNPFGPPTNASPYNYPPTELVPLDVWLGLTILGGNPNNAALCPSGTGSNSSCVIDNASIRYDQLQGRFVVLFTVTDLPAHRSNWVLVVSRTAQFTQCPTNQLPGLGGGPVCQTPLFTPPVIAPIVGGTSTGGVNPNNWFLFPIPINLAYQVTAEPGALGLVAAANHTVPVPVPYNNPLANSVVGTANTITTATGATFAFLTTPFCANGGPSLPLTPSPTGGPDGSTRSCTNYFPTAARFGIDNDNIILTAPVLDQAYSPSEGSFPSGAGQRFGPYAGTRVTTVSKISVYNFVQPNLAQPGTLLAPSSSAVTGNCLTNVSCGAVNLSDNTATGTLSLVTRKIAFGFGLPSINTAPNNSPKPNADLQYGTTALANSCITNNPLATTALYQPTQIPANIVLSCAPVNNVSPGFSFNANPSATIAALIAANPLGNASTVPGSPANNSATGGSLGDFPAIFWEPDNLRGRALASFDAQVGPFGTPIAGVIAPFDYLVGTEISDNFGQGLVRIGTAGTTGQASSSVTVTELNNTSAAVGPPAVAATITVSAADAARLVLGEVLITGVGAPGTVILTGATITAINTVTGVITLSSDPFPQGAGNVGAALTFVFSIAGVNPTTAGISTINYLQPIVFSCPATALFGGPSSVAFCGTGVNGAQTLVADFPTIISASGGSTVKTVSTLGQIADPFPVGQGFGPGIDPSTGAPTQLTTNPLLPSPTSTAKSRLFVGDSRPEQVIFREGLLYIARSVRLGDINNVWLGTSTVLYDVIKTCATAQPGPTCTAPTSTNIFVGGGIGGAALAFEYEWFNGLNVNDPTGNTLGYGFYQPMFDVPADVVGTGPVAPISVLAVFDKLFVGMTTGGTNNTLATFSKDFPSLWDFRPGDDAYDTAQPYLDPYTGVVTSTEPCPSSTSVIPSVGSVSVTATLITAGSTQVTLASIPSTLAVGQTIQTGTPVTTSTDFTTANATQSLTGVNPVGNVATTAFTCNNNSPIFAVGVNGRTPAGCPAFASPSTFGIKSSTNVGLGEAIIGGRASGVATSTTTGSVTLTVPNTAQLAIGAYVTGSGIATGTFVQNISVNPDATLQVTLFNATVAPETATGATTVVFDSSPCFGSISSNSNATNPAVNNQRVIGTSTTSAFVNSGQTLPSVTGQLTAANPAIIAGGVPAAVTTNANNANNPVCSAFVADATVGPNTNPTVAAATVAGTTVTTTAITTPAVNPPLAVGFSAVGTGGTPVFITGIAGTSPNLVITMSGTPAASANNVYFYPPLPQLLGQTVNNGLPVIFLATNIVSGTIQFINTTNNTITLTAAASNPLPGQPQAGQAAIPVTTNIPITFNNGSTSANTAVCSLIPFSQRGGAATDPNDGSLWLYGQFAKNRLSTIPGPGQWGTSVANYALSFPATDPYGNDNTYFQDVQPPNAPVNGSIYFTWIQLAKNLGLAVPSNTGPCTINNGVNPIQQPPAAGQPPVAGGSQLGCPYFGPESTVTRAEMAYWVVRSQMDDAQVANYLCATGGDPTGGSTACAALLPAYSFADFGQVVSPFSGPIPSLNIAGVTQAQLQRYIEVMIRRGYTKGCGVTNDPQFGYCPASLVTREQMAVFLIRAKMNNVFPTSLSGSPNVGPYGDNFQVFTPTTPYFSDLGPGDAPYALFINKMRELRISNGTGPSSFSPLGTLTRKEIATFTVRAFFL